jgi:hypothetical protein
MTHEFVELDELWLEDVRGFDRLLDRENPVVSIFYGKASAETRLPEPKEFAET